MTTGAVIVSLLGIGVLAVAPLSAQRRSNVITSQDIADVGGKAGNAYDVVRMLRPQWLKVRDTYLEGDASSSSMVKAQGVHVYLNDVDQGDADYLKTIPVELIVELRWLSATEAGIRYGPTNGPGIVVTLKLPESR